MNVLAADGNQSLKAVLFLVCGIFVICFQDVIIKWISTSYPVFEIVLIRSIVALIPILVIAHCQGKIGQLKTARFGLHLLRASIMFVSYTAYYLSISALELADAVTVFLSAPFFIIVLSRFYLKENVDASKWIAIGIGFLGVVMIMNPQENVFEPAILLTLLAAFAYAVQSVLTRKLGNTDSGVAMAFYATLFYIAVSSSIGCFFWQGSMTPSDHTAYQFLTRPWIIPSQDDLILFVLLGFIAGFGFYFLSQAYRIGKASIVAPFEYIGVPLSIGLGYLFWGHVPEPFAIAGMFLIVAAGIFVLNHESKQNIRPPDRDLKTATD